MSIITVIPNEQTPRVPDIQLVQTPNSQEIRKFFAQNAKELRDFKDYAYTRFDAVGLAANQVQFDDYRFMVRAFALKDLNSKEPKWRIISDPRITEYIGMTDLRVEGCLTWKGKRIVAIRHRAVRVNYYDDFGELMIGEVYSGFAAQIWQHEINHLNGVEEHIEEPSFVLPKANEIQRNDRCPCNSGKKYKHCCLLLL
jgi:peptide deformylase